MSNSISTGSRDQLIGQLTQLGENSVITGKEGDVYTKESPATGFLASIGKFFARLFDGGESSTKKSGFEAVRDEVSKIFPNNEKVIGAFNEEFEGNPTRLTPANVKSFIVNQSSPVNQSSFGTRSASGGSSSVGSGTTSSAQKPAATSTEVKTASPLQEKNPLRWGTGAKGESNHDSNAGRDRLTDQEYVASLLKPTTTEDGAKPFAKPLLAKDDVNKSVSDLHDARKAILQKAYVDTYKDAHVEKGYTAELSHKGGTWAQNLKMEEIKKPAREVNKMVNKVIDQQSVVKRAEEGLSKAKVEEREGLSLNYNDEELTQRAVDAQKNLDKEKEKLEIANRKKVFADAALVGSQRNQLAEGKAAKEFIEGIKKSIEAKKSPAPLEAPSAAPVPSATPSATPSAVPA